MKRVPIPPTKYDPMRPVQAKMAAPVDGPGVGIPPTKYGPVPVQPRMMERAGAIVPRNPMPPVSFGRAIQRAAAAAMGTDTPAMIYLRQDGAKVARIRVMQIAGIGTDKVGGPSDIGKFLEAKYEFDCLAAWLIEKNVPYSKGENEKWLKECVGKKKKVLLIGDALYIPSQLNKPKKPKKPQPSGPAAQAAPPSLDTEAEIRYLIGAGFGLDPTGKHYEFGAAAPKVGAAAAKGAAGAQGGAALSGKQKD